MAPAYKYQKVQDDDALEEAGFDDIGSRFKIEQTRPSNPDLQHIVWFKRPSVFWLLPVFLLFNLAMGATAMPRMNVLISLICRNILKSPAGSGDTTQPMPRHEAGSMTQAMDGLAQNHTDAAVIVGEYNPQCSIDSVESATAMLQLWGNLIAGILGAIAAPIWGKISDRYGRIKPLSAASTVLLASETVMVVIAKMPDTFSLNWIYLSFLLEGFSGSFILIMALASSYASDCTSESGRNVGIGWFHGSMFFGFAAGPIFGGFLGMSGGQSRPMLIFYAALAMRAMGILFLVLLVPESFTEQPKRMTPIKEEMKQYIDKARQQSWIEKMKSANLLQIFTAQKISDKTVRRNLIALASVNTIMFGAFMGAMNVMLLYSEFIFGWGNKESGIFLSTVNFFRTLATVLVLPLAIRFLKRYFNPARKSAPIGCNCPTGGFDRLDVFLLRVSIFSDIIGYVGYALSPTGALFTLSGAVAAMGAVGLATSEASMTKLIGSDQTGELLGALGFLQAMARIIAPTVASLTYSWTVSNIPQLVFWGIAVCFVAAGVATFWTRPDTGSGVDTGEEAVPLQTRQD